jgi:hypothetical protein
MPSALAEFCVFVGIGRGKLRCRNKELQFSRYVATPNKSRYSGLARLRPSGAREL